MLISLKWLKQYVDIQEDIKELEKTLTMIGQEVEAIEEQGKNLDKVVIGHITEFGRHPEADKLTLLKVNIGDVEQQIICGAQNHKLGDKVVVALPGAVLPGDFKIKKSKIRGIESQGMLCSEVELGIGNEGSGIIILSEDATIGQEYREYANLNDVIFELEITPNRPDCLSYVGIAREIAAYYGRKLKFPEFGKSLKNIETLNSNHIDVVVEDKENCKRFSGKIIKNIKVTESPDWLKERLYSIGLKPVNNVVDATNYILFEMNQPLHAYDLNKISDSKIIVRKAEYGEKLVTLDEVERELKNNELVIADTEKVLGIAGIMGGNSSKVTNETTDIFLECAYFTPENIRKTSKNLGISSDSSYRFERGIDLENIFALERAAELISEITGGIILEGTIDKYIEKYEKVEISLDIEALGKFVGKEIDVEIVANILTNLGIEIKRIDSKSLIALPPSYRNDLTRTEDLYEEIIRMYGFENIGSKMLEDSIKAGQRDKMTIIVDKAKNILSKLGLQEVINYSFISKEALKILNIKESTMEILNPISDEMAVMRPTLMYSLLTNIRDNLNRNQNGLKFYEVSRVFSPGENGLSEETLKVAIALSGKGKKNLWNSKPEAMNFYDLKGIVEKFLEVIGILKYQLERSENMNFHPGRSADIRIGKQKIGTFGEIHPDLAETMDITKERTYIAELDLTNLQQYTNKKIKYNKIVKYPEVTRDLAIVLDRDVLVGNMLDDIKKTSETIENVVVFDIYEGDKIEITKKSVAISLVLRKKDGTLEENEIVASIDKILNLISEKYKGTIRQ